MSGAMQPIGLWLLALCAGAVAIGLSFVEWNRVDQRQRHWRLVATWLAILSLVLLAIRPVSSRGTPVVAHKEVVAVLWTGDAGTLVAPPAIDARNLFALPDATVPAQVRVSRMPDVATLRRRHPEITAIHVLGGGVDAADLPAFAGLQVDFTSTPRPDARPAIDLLNFPRRLPLGTPPMLAGRVAGLRPGQTVALIVEGPDGETSSQTLAAANDSHETTFRVRAKAPPAVGKFVWKLRLQTADGNHANLQSDETIGIDIVPPTLPRLLVLESAPRFDLTLLRQWYETAGGTLRARVRVGQDRYRYFAAANTAAAEFPALDAALLENYDVVVADARALASLPANEREILRTAVSDKGLGILTLADDAVLPPAVVAPDRAWVLPWKLRAIDRPEAPEAGEEEEHLARLEWRGLSKPLENEAPVAPCEIILGPGQTSEVRGDQGRTFVAASALGYGHLALTLVRETGRWPRTDQAGTFAAYWSFLLDLVARPIEGAGRWQVINGDDGPLFVDQPMELTWTAQPNAGSPPKVEVRLAGAAASSGLSPAQDRNEPGRWHVTFWPRQPGWYRVENVVAGQSDSALNFYINTVENWPALASERRRLATANYAARQPVDKESRPIERVTWTGGRPVSFAAVWFFLFLLSAGFLWTERRLTSA